MMSRKPAYEGKPLSPWRQGPATEQTTGVPDPDYIRANEPMIPPRPINPRNPNELQNPNIGGIAR